MLCFFLSVSCIYATCTILVLKIIKNQSIIKHY